MQEEVDEWGAFGGGADRSITAEPTDPPRDVPTAHGDGVEGPSVTPVVGDQSVQDDADFADFEAAPAAPAAVDDDDEFGDFAEQPPEPTAVTQPGPGPVDGGDEDEFASFDEAPAPPSHPPPTPPVSMKRVCTSRSAGFIPRFIPLASTSPNGTSPGFFNGYG